MLLRLPCSELWREKEGGAQQRVLDGWQEWVPGYCLPCDWVNVCRHVNSYANCVCQIQVSWRRLSFLALSICCWLQHQITQSLSTFFFCMILLYGVIWQIAIKMSEHQAEILEIEWLPFNFTIKSFSDVFFILEWVGRGGSLRFLKLCIFMYTFAHN